MSSRKKINSLPFTYLPLHLYVLTLNPPTSPPPSFVLPLSSSLPPPSSPASPSGALGLPLPLIQTSWGFFHRANYRQLGAQRITFSVQGKAKARVERTVLQNTQILDREGVCVRMCVCVSGRLGVCEHACIKP